MAPPPPSALKCGRLPSKYPVARGQELSACFLRHCHSRNEQPPVLGMYPGWLAWLFGRVAREFRREVL